MSKKITIEMTREQAQAVMDATELLARWRLGNSRKSLGRCPYYDAEDCVEQLQADAIALLEAQDAQQDRA